MISKMWCYECLREMIPHVYTVQFDVEPQAALVSWFEMGNCTGNRWNLGKGKPYRISPPFASDFRLLRAFVIGRLKRLEEITLLWKSVSEQFVICSAMQLQSVGTRRY